MIVGVNVMNLIGKFWCVNSEVQKLLKSMYVKIFLRLKFGECSQSSEQ